jgi:hypothetical protein
VWEFSLGVIAQILLQRKRISKTISAESNFATNLALSVVFASLFLPKSTFQFPSLLLIVPLIAVVFLLCSTAPSKSNPILNSKILNYLGDRSYSIYLWHWPFIVFGRYIFSDSFLLQNLMLALSIFIALVTYRYVENPLRRMTDFNWVRMSKVVAIFILFPLALSAGLGYSSSAVQFDKYQSGEIKGNYEGDVGAVNFESFSRLHPPSCISVSGMSFEWLAECEVDVLVIGDSHAQHLLPGFVSNFSKLKFAALSSDVYSSTSPKLRKVIQNQILINPNIQIVLFNSYWAKNGVSPNMRELIKTLTQKGLGVVILDDVPNFPFDAFTCKYGLSAFIKKSNCSSASDGFRDQRETYLPMLYSALENFRNTELIVTTDQYCSNTECSMLKNGQLHYLDLNHLN